MNYILAIDQGTSSTRAMIYSMTGDLIASSQYPLQQYYPEPGWVEHDPEEIWQKTLTAMRDVVSQVPKDQIIACGVTNQRETTLIWNKKTGKCLAPAIVWQDRRTADFCQSLAAQKEMIREKTGLIPDPYFSATKLHWLLEHYPEAKSLANQGDLAFGTIDSFLIWRLTGNHATDVTNASRTMIFNIKTEQWDQDLLNLFQIPDSVLPEVRACDDHFGIIEKQWLGVELPITGVAGDQQAALVGQGCFASGTMKATYGTGGFLLLNTGDKPVDSQHKLLTTIAYKIKGKTAYGLEGSLYNAGTTVKWLRDGMNLIHSYDETETLARILKSNDGVYLVSSFTGMGAPYWISKPGALIVGLSLSSTRAHIARAALEGVCYQTRELFDCMREDSQLDFSLLRVDGGMTVNSWFLQFLSDQCYVRVEKPNDVESTAKGAAIIAALGCGALNSVNELHQFNTIEKQFFPERDAMSVAADYAGWKDALSKIE